jgi:hypothetical protein
MRLDFQMAAAYGQPIVFIGVIPLVPELEPLESI